MVKDFSGEIKIEIVINSTKDVAHTNHTYV